MRERADDIRRHIAVLSDFEVSYGEFISAVAELRRTGGRRWSDAEFTQRKRDIQKESVRADLAMKASGVGQLVFTDPPALGGGIRSKDLPSQIFDFDQASAFLSDDGLDLQRGILERIPSQIAGLELRLEEFEADGAPRRQRARPIGVGRLAWVNHPWTITVVGGIVAAVVAAAIIALLS